MLNVQLIPNYSQVARDLLSSIKSLCEGIKPPGSLFSGENGRCHVTSFFGLCGNTKTLGRSIVRALFTGFTGSTSSGSGFTGSIGSINSRFYRLPFARFIG